MTDKLHLDRAHLHQILDNLLANAARYCSGQPGAIRLWAEVLPGERIALHVHDDGPGFDVAAALEKSRRGDSTGLGGMKDRVALYGGRLVLESGQDGTRLEAMVPMPGETGILPP